MKTSPGSRPWPSLLLLAGAASVVALSSCMDRELIGPSQVEPQFAVWSGSEPCAAAGSASIDGLLNEPDWYEACTAQLVADLAGSRSTTVTARFMNDGTTAYFSAVSDAPFSNPNSVLRIFLERDGVIHAIGITGNAATQWTCSSLNDCTVAGPVPLGATAVRRNYSGGTAYEIGWPLGELFEGLETGEVVAVRWETIPGGSAQPTLYPAANADPLQVRISGEGGGEYNDPALPDIVITTQYAATVTLRNPDADPFVDPTAFQCKIAQPNGSGGFTARFNDLPEGTQWVGTAGNKKTCNHLIWPPLDPAFEPDFAVPGQQGAVFIESAGPPRGGSSAALTWTNWLTAKGNAIPLEVVAGEGEIREWYIAFQGLGRNATCTANGNGTTVYAIEPGNHPAIPASPDQPPPGLALTYALRNACSFSGLSFGTTLIFQMRNQDGGESNGILLSNAPGGTNVPLFQQSSLQGSTFLVDAPNDGSPVDLRGLFYGPVENGDGVLTGQFSILATFQGWNDKKKEAQVNFDVVLDRGMATEQTIQVTAFYLDKPTRTRAAGWTVDASPSHQRNRVTLGSVSPTTSPPNGTTFEGGVEILISNWTGVTSADIRVRANLSDRSTDNMPNSGHAPWPSGNGGSFASPF